MKNPVNIAPRIKHFNSRIKEKEGKIKFSKALGTDKNDPFNYTSLLFEKEMKNGADLEVYEGLCRLYRVSVFGERHLVTEGQSFLHVLFYLAYYNSQRIQKEKEAAKLKAKEEKAKARLAKAAKPPLSTHPSILDFAEKIEKEKQEESTGGGFELIEEDGVTKIKGTNFVISKFL